MRRHTLTGTIMAAALACGAQAGQILVNETFENGAGGWFLNGNQVLFDGGNPGRYLGVPLVDSFGLRLNTTTGPLMGDLTRFAALEFSLDMRTFQFSSLGGLPLDPRSRPFALEFVDFGDGTPADRASVFVVGPHLPFVQDGWTNLTFSVPTTTGAELPAGWGGTGDFDQSTFEPILPAHRTFESVMGSVDEVRITTFVPGMIFGFALYEMGVDNLVVRAIPAPSAGALACLALGAATRRRRR